MRKDLATAPFNLLLAGVGGQGTLLASKIICAALLEAGYDVKLSEVHGMAQRGGSVVSQIRFGDEVHSPLFGRGEADVLLAFERLEGVRHLASLAQDGAVILGDQVMLPMPVIMGVQPYPEDALAQLEEGAHGRLVAVRAREVAAGLGNPRAANTVLVGVFAGWLAHQGETRLSLPGWLGALASQVPARHREVNQAAFEAGYRLGAA